jgi:hypothetical protein
MSQMSHKILFLENATLRPNIKIKKQWRYLEYHKILKILIQTKMSHNVA